MKSVLIGRPLFLNTHCDVDWVGLDIDDCRSIFGLAIFLNPNLISWSSHKQQIIARSSMEVEYRSIAQPKLD